MIRLATSWRRLDQYILRNHPEIWLLRIHHLLIWAILSLVLLALMTALLPRTSFLLLISPLTTISAIISMTSAMLWLPAQCMKLDGVFPLVRKSRWPLTLSRFCCLALISSPLLVFPLMAQVRIQDMTQDYNFQSWYIVRTYCPSDILADPYIAVGELCKEAIAKFIQTPEEQLARSQIFDTLVLHQTLGNTWKIRDLFGQLLGGLNHFDVIMALLFMAYVSQCFDLLPRANGTVNLLRIVLVYILPTSGVALSPIEEHSNNAWLSMAIICILVFIALVYVARAPKMSKPRALACWVLSLLGLPLLVMWGPRLLAADSLRHYCHAALLAAFLALTPWLQRQHDRVRAIPS